MNLGQKDLLICTIVEKRDDWNIIKLLTAKFPSIQLVVTGGFLAAINELTFNKFHIMLVLETVAEPDGAKFILGQLFKYGQPINDTFLYYLEPECVPIRQVADRKRVQTFRCGEEVRLMATIELAGHKHPESKF